MTWSHFLKTLVGLALGAATLLYAGVLMIDPYDSVWFSPPLERAPISLNQRFSYPALARKDRFDSIVVGTSTSALLRPEKLNQALGGSFANLSLDNGLAYEQWRILDLFARYHPNARTAIIGLDLGWCWVGDDYQEVGRWPFPHWLYDENRWNDLVRMLSLPAIEHAARQLAHLLGLRRTKYDRDGYANFLPAAGSYDLARAQWHIYGEKGPRRPEPVVPEVVVDGAGRASWTYPTHSLLREMLGVLPKETRKIVMFPPYHHFLHPAPGSLAAAQWEECRMRIAEVAGSAPNALVLDFMIPSEITLRDENYWDGLHYNAEVADRLAVLVGRAVTEKTGVPGLFDLLAVGPSR